MDGPERDTGGRFVDSGNRNGAPPGKRRKKLQSPSDFRQAILRIANRKMQVKSRDGNVVEKTTLFEAHVLNLATGETQNRLGSKNFIDLVQHSAALEEQVGPGRRNRRHA